MAVWALVAPPPHLRVTVRLDKDVAKVSVFCMIPLITQNLVEQADVWALLLVYACELI